jgi:hypothetical protein
VFLCVSRMRSHRAFWTAIWRTLRRPQRRESRTWKPQDLRSRVNKEFLLAPVLRIRIRKKLGFGYGFGSRHCCRMKIEDQTIERKKSYVFLLKKFVLWRRYRTGSRTHMNAIEAPFRKTWGQNISLRIRIQIRIGIRTKKFCGSASEKNEFGSTTLVSTYL